MEIQETIIVFILGIITGVVISKHIGNWAINRVSEMLTSKIDEAVKAKEAENCTNCDNGTIEKTLQCNSCGKEY